MKKIGKYIYAFIIGIGVAILVKLNGAPLWAIGLTFWLVTELSLINSKLNY